MPLKDKPLNVMPLNDTSTPQHVYIVLHYDSLLKKNKLGPLMPTKDPKVSYDFTVKQRLLAEQAKMAETLEELEGLVCISCYK